MMCRCSAVIFRWLADAPQSSSRATRNPLIIAIPSDAQINQVNLDRSIGIFKDRFADASDFTYLMVGNFKVDEVIPLLEKYIGGLPSIKRKETWKDVTPGFPKGLVVVEVPKNSEPQSTVAMVWKGDFKWNDKDRQGFSDANEYTINKMQGINA